MSMESLIPRDPVELASLRAEQLTSQDFEIAVTQERLLAELEHGAETLGFLDRGYFIEANTAFIAPVSFPSDHPVTYVRFGEGLSFEGTFATYSQLHIGRIIGIGAVRAIFMAFSQALLFPDFDTLPETDLLYVPVLAVNSISASS